MFIYFFFFFQIFVIFIIEMPKDFKQFDSWQIDKVFPLRTHNVCFHKHFFLSLVVLLILYMPIKLVGTSTKWPNSSSIAIDNWYQLNMISSSIAIDTNRTRLVHRLLLIIDTNRTWLVHRLLFLITKTSFLNHSSTININQLINIDCYWLISIDFTDCIGIPCPYKICSNRACPAKAATLFLEEVHYKPY